MPVLVRSAHGDGPRPLTSRRAFLVAPNLLMALLLVLVGSILGQEPAAEGADNDFKFIHIGKSVDTRTAWPKPTAHNGRDLVWVITADPLAFDLAHAYFLVNDAAMLLLLPLLRRTHADLVKANTGGHISARNPAFAKVVKQIESVLSEYDPEIWDLDEPEYGVPSPRTGCIEAVRALLMDEGWKEPPFEPEHLSEATARLWVRFAELVRCLWGDERFGFPGWALKTSWKKLGLPQRGNTATFHRGGILPRVGDFLNFEVTRRTVWARRPGWGRNGVFASSTSTREALAALVETGAREPAGVGSFRGALWRVLESMLGGASPVNLPESGPLRLPLAHHAADAAWSSVRTESILASAALIRRGTLDSLLCGCVRGGRRFQCEPPRLFVLYAIDPPTWQALEQAVTRLKEARQVGLDLEARFDDDSLPFRRHGIPRLESVTRWKNALLPLAETRAKQNHLLVQRLSLDEKLTGLIRDIQFSNNKGLRTPTTRPLADPAQARDRIPTESWLRAEYSPRPLRRICFRFLLEGNPIEGIGVAPIVEVKNSAGKLVALHATWSR